MGSGRLPWRQDAAVTDLNQIDARGITSVLDEKRRKLRCDCWSRLASGAKQAAR
jgi:hypothetical protein